MVKDTITDSKRIAELLASELTGMVTGSLSAVEVVDADRDATPSPQGTVAYAIAAHGKEVGRVLLYPEATAVVLDVAADGEPSAVSREGLEVETSDEGLRLLVSTGAAVKGAVDILRSTLP